MSSAKKYDSDDIRTLQFPENIREKPTLYIGPIDESGVFTIVREVADNVVDEALAGRASKCDIFIQSQVNEDTNKKVLRGIYVLDNGEGIPVKDMTVENPFDGKKLKIPAIKAILTMTHTSGKFHDKAYAAARGCFAGQTKIELVDGRTLSFKQLYREYNSGIKNYVWTVSRKTGELRAQPIEQVHLTKKTRDLVKVTLDTGESFVCTPDHPLYSTALKKIQAQDAQDRSLLAINFKTDKDGYRIGSVVGHTNQQRLHRVVAGYYGQDINDKHVHHLDENTLNNEPHNLEALTPQEHYERHPDKLSTWMAYLARSSSEKSDLLKERNSQIWYKIRVARGKALKVACRLVLEGIPFTRKNYQEWSTHGTPSWGNLKKCFASQTELVLLAERLVEYAQKQSSKGRNVGKTFLRSLQYKPGLSELSMTKDHSPEMAAKRILGKAVKALSKTPNPNMSIQEFTECFDSKTISPRALSQYIDLEEFISAVINDVDPIQFVYQDLSDSEMAIRRRKFDQELAEEKSKDWGTSTTVRVFNDFMRKLNAMLDEGVPICGSKYHDLHKNAFGNSNWFLGVAAARKLGLKTKTQIVQAAKEANHKVVSVERYEPEHPIPVFDLTVPVDHNYRLDCGIVVGNTHGLGVKASNALSRAYKVWTYRDGSWWHIAFEYGKTKIDLTKAKKAPEHPVTGNPLKKGTLVYLEPDPKIFNVMTEIPLSKIFAPTAATMTTLLEWCRIASYFTPGMTLTIHHEAVKGGAKVFFSENGPKDFISRRIGQLNKARREENPDGKVEEIQPISEDAEFIFQNTLFECILTFTNSEIGSMDAFTNGLRNAEGGVHLTAMMTALYAALQPYTPKGKTFTQRELREGLVSLINVRLSSPQFNSQTKEKLVDERGGKPVHEFLLDELNKFFKKRKDLAVKITERAANLHALKSKFLASKKVITALRSVAKKGLPVKGTVAPDCKPAERELFIIEGDSAGGCFVGDTLIATATGPVPIRDLVYQSRGPAWDQAAATPVVSRFSKSVITKMTTELVEVTMTDGSTVTCTPDHPFLLESGEWVNAEDLNQDSILRVIESRI